MNQYNRDFNGNDIFEYDTSCGRMLDRCVCVLSILNSTAYFPNGF